MPFTIVRNDITQMKTDAIVNSVSSQPLIGSGVDLGIHRKAGPELLKARQSIGNLVPGQAAITPGFRLSAGHVIHVVCPPWTGGARHEEALLKECCQNALALAEAAGLSSIAFPLLGSGNLGFPRDIAMKTMVRVFSDFLMDHDLDIILVVLDGDSYQLSRKLFKQVETYIEEHLAAETCSLERSFDGVPMPSRQRRNMAPSCAPFRVQENVDWDSVLREKDAGFSETLLSLIEKSGKKNSQVYKKANLDKKLFSKIINNVNYHPSKQTALALAISLELSLPEALDLIGRAGFTLSHSSKFDIILEYFLVNRSYDIFEINEVLFRFDQPLLGS